MANDMNELRSKATETALLAATGLKRPKKASAGDVQKYLRKLAEHIGALSEGDWNALSQEAKDWYNGVACDETRPATDPTPDFIEPQEEEPVRETKDQPPANIRRPLQRRGNGKKPRRPSRVAELVRDRAKTKATKPARSGSTAIVVEGLLLHGGKDNDFIAGYVKKKGGQATPQYCGTVRTVVRAALDVMRERKDLYKTAKVMLPKELHAA